MFEKTPEWYVRWHDGSKHAFAHWLSFLFVVALIFGQVSNWIASSYPTNFLTAAIGLPVNAHMVANAGQYLDSKGASHEVDVWAFTNTQSGGNDYFVLALPSVTSGPYPVIIYNNPYVVFPSPPSTNAEDGQWTSRIRQSQPSVDVSLLPQNKFLTCSTPDCPISVNGLVALTNLPVLSEGRSADWAITNGYAVAFSFARHYAARDTLTVIYDIENVIKALKSNPSIDPNHIGITGGSQGGHLSIHPLVLNGIAASVAEYPWIDGRAMYNYYFNTLPSIQPSNLLTRSHDFVKPYFDRLFKAFGSNINSSSWDYLTTNYVAQNFNTPILLLQGTDDMMIPVSESSNFYTALKNNGKTVNKWIYQNGPPPLATRSVDEGAHGITDANSPVKSSVLARNFFLQYMPPKVSEVVYNVPGDVDLRGMLASFRSAICSTPENKENISGLILQAANPKIKYRSSDSLVPTGTGPTAVSAAMNFVWSAEGLAWTKDNIISNLQNGLLPSSCGGVVIPTPTQAPIPTSLITPTPTPLIRVPRIRSTGRVSIISNQNFCWHFDHPNGGYNDCGTSVSYPNAVEGQYTVSIESPPAGYHLKDYSPKTDTQNLIAGQSITWTADWQSDTSVSSPAQLSITTDSTLPSAVVGQMYSTSFTALGGTGNYAWSVSSGIPPGVFESNCSDNFCEAIGTPSTAGTYNFTATVRSGEATASKEFTLVVNPVPAIPLTITTASYMPDAIVGVRYSATFTAAGGNGEYIWSLDSGMPGTRLFKTACLNNSCFSTGIPTVAGNYTVDVIVLSGAQEARKQFTLRVLP